MAANDLIDMFAAHLREMSRTKRTIGTYTDQLTYADRGTPFGLDCATTAELKAWIWRDGLSPASRALAYASLVAFFKWAVDVGELDFDPTTKITRPQVPMNLPRVARDDQAKYLVTEAPQPYRRWAILAAFGGLRCIEMYRLDRDDITQENIRIYGKGDKIDFVPTHPALWAEVKDLPPGPVVDVPDERAISSRFKGFCHRRGLKKMSLHRLRGWFGTAGYRATKNPRAVQRALRHGNLATTMRYIAWAEDDVQAVVNGLPSFGGEAGGLDAERPGPSEPR